MGLVTELVTQTEIARRKGCSRPAVSKYVKLGKLEKARVGKHFDADHPDLARYLRKTRQLVVAHREEPDEAPPPPPAESSSVLTSVDVVVPTKEEILNTRAAITADVRKVGHLSLNDVIRLFGTTQCLKDFLSALKTMEDVYKKRLDAAIREKGLVSLKLVRTSIVEGYNIAFKRLLSDGAKAIVYEVKTHLEMGTENGKIEEMVSLKMSEHITPAQDRIVKALKAIVDGQ